MGSWNSLQVITQYRLGWTADELTWYSSLITTMTNVGAMIGSIGAGFLVSIFHDNRFRFALENGG